MKNDKSVEDFMKELDQLEAAGELADDEPAFQGHTLNLTKWEAYQHIKNALEGLLTTSQYVKAVRGQSKPYPADQDATVSVTVPKLAMFTEKETVVLSDAMAKADRFSFTAIEDSAFLNFTVKDIWINGRFPPL